MRVESIEVPMVLHRPASVDLATTRFALVQYNSLYRFLILGQYPTISNTSLSLADVKHILMSAIAGAGGQAISARAFNGIAERTAWRGWETTDVGSLYLTRDGVFLHLLVPQRIYTCIPNLAPALRLYASSCLWHRRAPIRDSEVSWAVSAGS
jgi:hypothetical protein